MTRKSSGVGLGELPALSMLGMLQITIPHHRTPVVMFSATTLTAYALGLTTFIIIPRAFDAILRLLSHEQSTRRNDIYGLEHALLNIKVPPETMWMNMGYWKNTVDFPTACQNLMLLMLEKSRILISPGYRSVRFWDLGFGCGDQTLLLCTELEKAGVDLTKYDGITINPSQFNYAQDRILDANADLKKDNKDKIISLHLADASNPKFWPAWAPGTNEDNNAARWTLALDSLYHFQPSRYPVLHHVSHNLSSSLLAFDLLRSTSTTPLQRLLLRLICLLTQIPYSNLLTIEQYTELLVSVGYERSEVEIFDITCDVFPGLEGFIERRGRIMKDMGVAKGWGRFGVVGKIVGWWGRTEIVRGCIIIARMDHAKRRGL